MDEWLERLSVGDEVIVKPFYGLARVAKVTRATKHQIDAGGTTFNRKTGTQRGGGQWTPTRLGEATPEAVDAVCRAMEKAKALNRISKTRWAALSLDDLTAVLKIVDNAKAS